MRSRSERATSGRPHSGHTLRGRDRSQRAWQSKHSRWVSAGLNGVSRGGPFRHSRRGPHGVTTRLVEPARELVAQLAARRDASLAGSPPGAGGGGREAVLAVVAAITEPAAACERLQFRIVLY